MKNIFLVIVMVITLGVVLIGCSEMTDSEKIQSVLKSLPPSIFGEYEVIDAGKPFGKTGLHMIFVKSLKENSTMVPALSVRSYSKGDKVKAAYYHSFWAQGLFIED